MKTGKLASLSVAALFAVAVAGCDEAGGSPNGGGEQQGTQQSAAAGGVVDASGAAQSGEGQGNGQGQGQSGQPIATRELSDSGAGLRVDITSLKRSDRLATLNWTITVVKGNEYGVWNMGDRLAARAKDGFPTGEYNVSAVSLVDTGNAKRYLVARSGGSGEDKGECVCSKALPEVKEGEAASFSATFTAPPPDVTKVTVDLVFGTFDDVSIS